MLSYPRTLSLAAAVVASTLAVGVTATPASARSEPVVVTGTRLAPARTVSYRDLNLSLASHRKQLIRRVDQAVGDVCDEINDSLARFDQDSACRGATWKSSQPQIALAIARANSGGSAEFAMLTIAAQPAG